MLKSTIILFLSFLAISYHRENKGAKHADELKLLQQHFTTDSVFSFDESFINNEILRGKSSVKLSSYLKEDCYPISFKKPELVEEFKGYQNIGDIDNDGDDDSVFVLNPLNYCEEGESYYFSNPNIERLYTESVCCHPENIFSIGDIDEDGRSEIGQYFSSCVSRYKRIYIWTLKNNTWKAVGDFTFTLNPKFQPIHDFDKLHKKKRKGVFQFLEISDVNLKNEIISEWKTIIMK